MFDIKEALKTRLKIEEGFKLKPYTDTVGKLTIGIGRNLDDVGITEDEALFMLETDIDIAIKNLETKLPWTVKLDEIRKLVLVDMVFNMGINGILQFKNTLSLIQTGKFEEASVAMLESKWASQVGERAKRLSEIMKTGIYNEIT